MTVPNEQAMPPQGVQTIPDNSYAGETIPQVTSPESTAPSAPTPPPGAAPHEVVRPPGRLL